LGTSIIFVISKIVTRFSGSPKEQQSDEKTEKSLESFVDKQKKPNKPKIMLATESCNNFESLDKESPQQCSRCQFYQEYSSDLKKENMTFGYCRYID
jgi:hypothetical protein